MTHLVPLAEALTPLREVYAHLLTAAVARQAGRGRPVDPDHLALLCVAADSGGSDATPTRWTRTSVYHVLRVDVPNWLSRHRCPWPDGLPEALWDWLDFLVATGRLDPASDPPAELRKPLQCYGGLDEGGRPRPPGAPCPVACECRLPYRETADLLNRLGLQCEWRGQDALDVLRALVGYGPRHPGAWEPDAGDPWDEVCTCPYPAGPADPEVDAPDLDAPDPDAPDPDGSDDPDTGGRA